MSDLTSEESFLLKWLDKEESSALGECESHALTVLINLGLAEIKDTSDGPGRASPSRRPVMQNSRSNPHEIPRRTCRRGHIRGRG